MEVAVDDTKTKKRKVEVVQDDEHTPLQSKQRTLAVRAATTSLQSSDIQDLILEFMKEDPEKAQDLLIKAQELKEKNPTNIKLIKNKNLPTLDGFENYVKSAENES